MEIQEIKALNQELSVRGLKYAVKSIIRQKRPNCSEDTFARAFQLTEWEKATPLLREILGVAKNILDKDNERIACEVQEFEVAT